MATNGEQTQSVATLVEQVHLSELGQNLFALQQKGKMCDVKLTGSDGQVKVHSIVLIGCGKTTQDLVLGDGNSQVQRDIDLRQYDVITLQNVVLFLYTGQVKVGQSPEKTRQLRAALTQLKFPDAAHLLGDFTHVTAGSSDVRDVSTTQVKAKGDTKMASVGVGLTQDWHKSPELTKKLDDFHAQKASPPTSEDMKKAKQKLNEILDKLQRKLSRMNRCTRFEYAGSSYEGVKTKVDLEFDILVVLPDGKHLQSEAVRPGYGLLKPKAGNADIFSEFLQKDGNLSPEKCLDSLFKSALQKCLNEDEELGRYIKLSRHGPAIQMDVSAKELGASTDLWYSVDMVPMYELAVENPKEGPEQYVAKPIKEVFQKEGMKSAWRRSYTVKEKQKYKTIDEGSLCHRKCARILKTLRDSETSLKTVVTSYIIKNCVFHVSDQQASWKQDDLGERVIDLITYLAQSFENKQLWSYFEPKLNLLENLNDKTMDNIADRLKKWLKNKNQFYKVLDKPIDK